MRPHQWVKNVFVLAPLVFAQRLGEMPATWRAGLGFAFFSAAASAIYILNDLADIEADRAHPKKRHRPLPSGAVSEGVAKAGFFVLLAIALVGGGVLSLPFAGTVLGYVLLNVAYTHGLKRVAYVDVLCIATGFELRVLAGTFAAEVPPTLYLLGVTFLLALFLGFGKRMHELTQGKGVHKQRSVLSKYAEKPLRALLLGAGLGTVVLYAVYCLDPDTRETFGTSWLVWTVPFAAIGVFRFLHLVSNRPDAESPTEEMLRDPLFVGNLVAGAAAIVGIIYFA